MRACTNTSRTATMFYRFQPNNDIQNTSSKAVNDDDLN